MAALRAASHRFALALAVAVLSAALPAASALAAPRHLKIDPQHSAVRMEIDALAHTVHGTFKVTGGALDFDPEAGTASGTVTVDAHSAETGNDGRDRKMHETVLESARYPEIVFTASKIAGRFVDEGASNLRLEGTIAIHGTSHAVVLQVHAETHAGVVTASAPLTVPFVAWGMQDPSNFLLRIAKQVAVQIEARGTLE